MFLTVHLDVPVFSVVVCSVVVFPVVVFALVIGDHRRAIHAVSRIGLMMDIQLGRSGEPLPCGRGTVLCKQVCVGIADASTCQLSCGSIQVAIGDGLAQHSLGFRHLPHIGTDTSLDHLQLDTDIRVQARGLRILNCFQCLPCTSESTLTVRDHGKVFSSAAHTPEGAVLTQRGRPFSGCIRCFSNCFTDDRQTCRMSAGHQYMFERESRILVDEQTCRDDARSDPIGKILGDTSKLCPDTPRKLGVLHPLRQWGVPTFKVALARSTLLTHIPLFIGSEPTRPRTSMIVPALMVAAAGVTSTRSPAVFALDAALLLTGALLPVARAILSAVFVTPPERLHTVSTCPLRGSAVPSTASTTTPGTTRTAITVSTTAVTSVV